LKALANEIQSMKILRASKMMERSPVNERASDSLRIGITVKFSFAKKIPDSNQHFTRDRDDSP